MLNTQEFNYLKLFQKYLLLSKKLNMIPIVFDGNVDFNVNSKGITLTVSNIIKRKRV